MKKMQKQNIFLFENFVYFLAVFLCSGVAPVFAATPTQELVFQNPDLVQQGRTLYETGQFSSALAVWQQAQGEFEAKGDVVNRAMVLSNLSLTYQQLGQWKSAEKAIASSLELLKNSGTSTKESKLVLAQALNTQASLQLALHSAEKAVDTWQQAAEAYEKAGERVGSLRAKINQAQALRSLGLYRRSLETLQQVNQGFSAEPDSQTKAAAGHTLGNALRLVGNVDESRKVLEQSLTIAQRLQSSGDTANALLSLGNTSRAQRDTKAALAYYQQAAAIAASPTTKANSLLNQLSLLVETKQQAEAVALWPQIEALVANLPASRQSVDARINLAQSLMKLSDDPTLPIDNLKSKIQNPKLLAAQLLATAVEQARQLKDPRAESYALGGLGNVYEQSKQWSEAISLSSQALILAQSIDASDIAYKWQWQMGRLLKLQGKNKQAIAAYTQAVNSLQLLRTDLVAINSDVQFSFRESVEPVYRQLVSLLLQPDEGSQPSQENLIKARQTIESLQLAELDNFFRENCLTASPKQIDQVDRKAVAIYPIILEDRLETIVSQPDAPLRHYTTPISRTEIEKTVVQLRQLLVTRTNRNFLPVSQKVYNWLIKPIEADLEKSQIKTLVFVLDGPFLNVPMATLHDGKQYLVEKYGIALTPGLQLLDPKPLARQPLKALTAGLTEARQNFSALPQVAEELRTIKSEVPSKVLLDQQFTSIALQQAIQNTPFPVVHIATHGEFSSKAEDTFILTWDGKINVNQLDNLLRSREKKGTAIELLVLSACKTASGDKRAALGLAGVAIKAGARSTVASLWYVSDEATANLMTGFYRELGNTSVTKAEALRRAQQSLLQKPEYRHPYFWAPFVMVGNWL
ncbi:CHAT domain-containing protein [Microcoleus sp. FACHB-831]|uniref:CHAT domain-containing protein n=1 Tax=Microcoleus sp. FACHB-831 TaxID=2692827 RepID=UPI001F550CF7|nr:CHAT domain-containing protein [Microcoleus sp. FACHB-831]